MEPILTAPACETSGAPTAFVSLCRVALVSVVMPGRVCVVSG